MLSRIRRACGVSIAAAALLATTTAAAEFINTTRIHLTIKGVDVVNVPGGGPNVPASSAGTRDEQGVKATFSATANQGVTAKSVLSGATAANLVTRGASLFNFKLTPPAGTNMKGVQLVLHAVLEGHVTDGASLHMVASIDLDGSPGSGQASATITSSTVPRAEMDFGVTVSPFAGPNDLGGRIRIYVDANAELDGVVDATYSAEATMAHITGFRVLSPAGVPMPGFTMSADGGGAIPEIGGVPGAGKAPAIEFFHAGLGHYFVSSESGEIARLDDGTFPGWSRTGQSFNVNTGPGAGLSAVCRFYTVAFPPSSSHFYTANAAECDALKQNPKWTYEKIAFYVPVPSEQGVCPAQTIPVFRLFNNGQGGAPNHRYTTSTDVRTEMIGKGWAAEGVTMCSPQ
ncbi:MAG TPA: hypothetical protein PLM09_08055 [Casimicrobiaceae bacterium]|nr:hypothetical protein [Casimicrobiaceae bacterium]